MDNTCKTCRWWGNINAEQPEYGDCQNPAVVDDSGADPGQGTGVRMRDLDFNTQARFGCRFHQAESVKLKTADKQAAELKKARATIRRLRLEIANFTAYTNHPTNGQPT